MRNPNCRTPGCPREARVHGMCVPCYQRERKGLAPRPAPQASICTVNGCEHDVHGRGLCILHWRQWNSQRLAEDKPRLARRRRTNRLPVENNGSNGVDAPISVGQLVDVQTPRPGDHRGEVVHVYGLPSDLLPVSYEVRFPDGSWGLWPRHCLTPVAPEAGAKDEEPEPQELTQVEPTTAQ